MIIQEKVMEVLAHLGSHSNYVVHWAPEGKPEDRVARRRKEAGTSPRRFSSCKEVGTKVVNFICNCDHLHRVN